MNKNLVAVCYGVKYATLIPFCVRGGPLILFQSGLFDYYDIVCIVVSFLAFFLKSLLNERYSTPIVVSGMILFAAFAVLGRMDLIDFSFYMNPAAVMIAQIVLFLLSSFLLYRNKHGNAWFCQLKNGTRRWIKEGPAS